VHIAPPEFAAAPLQIESLDQEGRGVARRDGKTIFVEGALPGEEVIASVLRRKPSFDIATVSALRKASSSRVRARCEYFGRCGGCSFQHVDIPTQVAAKQRVMEDAFWHIARLRPELILPAIHGLPWGYRHRARFTVRYVPKKGGVLVGFHEKRSSYVADMKSCEVVPARISALLQPLRELVGQLSIRSRLPQIELSIGEKVDVAVLRVLEPLSRQDDHALSAFAKRHGVHFYIQAAGPESAQPLHPQTRADLYYELPEFDVRVYFEPTDFTQVNHSANAILVRRAMQLLAPRPGERIADLFCGLGNFSLPIARSGASVLGVEGSRKLVGRAQMNATRNGLGASVQFAAMNLFEMDAERWAALGRFDAILLDPPRDGASEVVRSLSSLPPARIVYVSCNPATLARDAAVLVHEHGYRLSAAGVVNMFPHTAHVESIAAFTLSPSDRGAPESSWA
jgi:23S rRNA (uracil1939-C5)-methyltransferase